MAAGRYRTASNSGEIHHSQMWEESYSMILFPRQAWVPRSSIIRIIHTRQNTYLSIVLFMRTMHLEISWLSTYLQVLWHLLMLRIDYQRQTKLCERCMLIPIGEDLRSSWPRVLATEGDRTLVTLLQALCQMRSSIQAETTLRCTRPSRSVPWGPQLQA